MPSSYSDYSPVITWPNINTTNRNPVALIINDTLSHLPEQFIQESESPQKFRATLQTEHMQGTIDEFLDDNVPSENVINSMPWKLFSQQPQNNHSTLSIPGSVGVDFMRETRNKHGRYSESI